MHTFYQIERVESLDASILKGLAEITLDVVEGGASVGFLLPFSLEKATLFWEKVKGRVESGEVTLLLARASESNQLIGTVQLITGLPENQPHRGDVAKMQVRSSFRKKGVGEALLKAIEAEAIRQGRSLLVLDTATDSDAQRLYTRLGWKEVGAIPNYALWPDGRPCSSTFFYKQL